MLAPLVVRVLGVLAKLPTCTLEGEIIERKGGEGGRRRRVTGNNKLPKLPKLLIINWSFHI